MLFHPVFICVGLNFGQAYRLSRRITNLINQAVVSICFSEKAVAIYHTECASPFLTPPGSRTQSLACTYSEYVRYKDEGPQPEDDIHVFLPILYHADPNINATLQPYQLAPSNVILPP